MVGFQKKECIANLKSSQALGIAFFLLSTNFLCSLIEIIGLLTLNVACSCLVIFMFMHYFFLDQAFNAFSCSCFDCIFSCFEFMYTYAWRMYKIILKHNTPNGFIVDSIFHTDKCTIYAFRSSMFKLLYDHACFPCALICADNYLQGVDSLKTFCCMHTLKIVNCLGSKEGVHCEFISTLACSCSPSYFYTCALSSILMLIHWTIHFYRLKLSCNSIQSFMFCIF